MYIRTSSSSCIGYASIGVVIWIVDAQIGFERTNVTRVPEHVWATAFDSEISILDGKVAAANGSRAVNCSLSCTKPPTKE